MHQSVTTTAYSDKALSQSFFFNYNIGTCCTPKNLKRSFAEALIKLDLDEMFAMLQNTLAFLFQNRQECFHHEQAPPIWSQCYKTLFK